MAIANLHQVGMIEYTIDPAAAAYINAITSSSINLGVDALREISGGRDYPDAAWVIGVAPSVSFGTLQIEQAVDAMAPKGVCIDPATDTLRVFAQTRACSGAAPSASHVTYAPRSAIMIPRILRVSHRGNAEMTGEIFFGTDVNTNAPITRATGVVMPSVVQADESARWTIGAGSTVAGTAISGITSIEADFNVEVINEGSDSEEYNTFIGFRSSSPRITLSGLDLTWMDTPVPVGGIACTNANTQINLLKRGVVPSTAEHITLNMAGVAYVVNAMDGQANTPATVSIVIEGVYDGTNAPLEVQTLQDIS